MIDGPADVAEDKIRLLMKLRRQGVIAADILDALERVPRHQFVPAAYRAEAYSDLPIPIGGGAHLIQPSLLGFMLQVLDLEPGHRLLEVGTGSGYAAAAMSLLVRRVYSIERDRVLERAAAARLQALGLVNVITLWADGALGSPVHAPFDRIIVHAAGLEVPPALVAQLAPEGKLIMPRYAGGGEQDLVLLDRKNDAVEETILLPVHFTPLLKGRAGA